MKRLYYIFMCLWLVGFIPQASADILLEPVVGYSLGSFNTDLKIPSSPSSNDTSKDSGSGLTYGGRFGLQSFGLQLGIDYLAGTLTIDGDDTKISELGAFIGYKFPVLMRFYAGYILSGTAETEDIKLEKGSGPKVGIGFTLLPLVHLNLEWRNLKYEQYEGSSSGIDYTIDADYSAYMLALSVPLTF